MTTYKVTYKNVTDPGLLETVILKADSFVRISSFLYSKEHEIVFISYLKNEQGARLLDLDDDHICDKVALITNVISIIPMEK